MTSSDTASPYTPSTAKAAGLTSYRSRRWCPIPGHGSIRRVVDNKCCGCIQRAKDLQAEARKKLLRAKDPEVVRKERAKKRAQERAREVKRLAAEALKAQKAALREQAQADRDKAKRAKRKAEREAERALEAQEAAEAVSVDSPAVAPLAAPVVVAVGSLGVPPWEEVNNTADYLDTACPWDDSPPWD